MNCSDCQTYLQERLDGVCREESAGLEQHLAACPVCRERCLAARRLEEGLCLLSRPLLPSLDLPERIVAGVLREQCTRQRRRNWARAAVALAASVVLVLVLGRDRPPAPERQQADNGATATDPTLRESVAEASSAMVSLTQRTADETVGQGRLLLPVVVAGTPMDMAGPSPLEPSLGSLREAGHGVSVGLEPVTNSARRAFDLFLREIPPLPPDGKSAKDKG